MSTGVTTNSFTATDECGNMASCSFAVTVRDEEAPVAICEPGPNPGGQFQSKFDSDKFWSIRATDNCPGVAIPRVEDLGTQQAFDSITWAPDGTNIKYTKIPGLSNIVANPSTGSVEWHLKGSGTLQVSANDSAGLTNVVLCLDETRLLRSPGR